MINTARSTEKNQENNFCNTKVFIKNTFKLASALSCKALDF